MANRGDGGGDDFALRYRVQSRRQNLPARSRVGSRLACGRKLYFSSISFQARRLRVPSVIMPGPACSQVRRHPGDTTEDRDVVLAQGTTNFSKFGVALVHALLSRVESISCMISMTRVPRSIESSRWKTRWGVYFKTTCFARADCKAVRCASS